jgi:hypothetical protein
VDSFSRTDHMRSETSQGTGPDTEGAHMARTNPFDPHALATSCDLFTDLQTEVQSNG